MTGPGSRLGRRSAIDRNYCGEHIAKKILTAMYLPTEVPELHPARPPPPADREARDVKEWLN